MKLSKAHAWEAHVSPWRRGFPLFWQVSIIRRDAPSPGNLRASRIWYSYRLTKTGARFHAQRVIERHNKECGTGEPIARVVNA